MLKFGQHVPARWHVKQVLVKCMKGTSYLLSHIYTYTEISVTHKTQKYIIFHIFLNQHKSCSALTYLVGRVRRYNLSHSEGCCVQCPVIVHEGGPCTIQKFRGGA